MSDEMPVPSSPRHPRPDEEVKELPEGQLPDIDLNPDLESDESGSEPDRKESELVGKEDTEGGFVRQVSINPEPVPGNGLEVSRADEMNETTDEMEEIDFPSITPTFDQAYEDAAIEFKGHQVITGPQQSRLVNYLDDELLKIQRKYVKAQSGQVSISVNDLILELKPLLKMVWLSITDSSTNMGEYFLKILTDLEDYLSYFPIPNPANHVFEILQYLDARICYLYDNKLYNATQFVRTLSIVSRLRMVLITKLSANSSTIIELESSKLFEGILERS